MMKNKLVRSSALFLSLLALGSASPALANDFNTATLERFRAAPGQDGIGFGALVVPSYSELGEFFIKLYGDQGVALYRASGSMSMYLPTTFLPTGRMRFGGFSGTLRELGGDGWLQPLSVGQLEGTWQMDGQGVGTMHGVAYRPDGDGVMQPFAIINGKFEAREVVLPEPGGFSALAGTGGGSGWSYSYSYTSTMAQVMAATPTSAGMIASFRKVGVQSGLSPVGIPPVNLELRIRQARAQAKANAQGQGNPGTSAASAPSLVFTVPEQPHLAGKILAMYKVID